MYKRQVDTMPDAVSAMAKDILAHHVLSPVGGVCSVCAQYVLGACQPCTSAYSYLWYGHIRAYGHETITAPTLHHHRSITAASLHSHCTITHQHRSITAPSLHHHCTITAPSLTHHCTNTTPSMYHHCTITAPSRHHHCTITAAP